MSVNNDTVAPSDVAPIPEALGSEDGEVWCIEGHVEPALAVLAVVVEEAALIDAETAISVLCGRHDRLDWHDARKSAAQLVDAVKHEWMKPHPTDEEQMLRAAPDEPGAEAWTVVRC